MTSIDEYIEKSKSMPNMSAGGSAAYIFDDVVLIKYVSENKYGIARDGEEEIFVEVSKKWSNGVKTPLHIAMKRINDGEKNYCYVLQQRAKGRIFNDYCENKVVSDQLAMQKQLTQIPQEHYTKFVSDTVALFNFGLELKPKNMFYDQNEGFTIIDLIDYKPKEFDPNSLPDINYLIATLQGVYNMSSVVSYLKPTKEEQALSSTYRNAIIKKIFVGMEQAIPNFEQYRRWILREMPVDTLTFFALNNVPVGNLALNSEEYAQFNSLKSQLINSCLQELNSGQRQLWDIEVNAIRNGLKAYSLNSAWLYHLDNHRNIAEYSGTFADYDYKRDSSQDLEEMVKNEFYQALIQIPDNELSEAGLSAKNNVLQKFQPNTGTSR